MAKDVKLMTESEIVKREEKLREKVTANCKDLIAAGLGHMQHSDMQTLDHPLAQEYRDLDAAIWLVRGEMAARKRWHGGLKRIIEKSR